MMQNDTAYRYWKDKLENLEFEAKDVPAMKKALGDDFTTIRDEDGDSPLHLLVSDPTVYLDLLKALLDADYPVDPVNNDGETPLIYAAREEQTEAVDVLLDYEADIDAADVIGQTALMNAAEKQKGKMVRHLIEQGADLTVKDANGMPVIHYLAQLEDIEPLRTALKSGIAPDTPYHPTPVARAASTTPLTMAAMSDEATLEHITLLLDSGASVDGRPVNAPSDKTFNHPVTMALIDDNLGALELLAERGCPMHDRGETLFALVRTTDRLVRLSERDATEIIQDRNLDDAMDILLANGLDPHATTEEGGTVIDGALALTSSQHIKDWLYHRIERPRIEASLEMHAPEITRSSKQKLSL